MAVFRVNKNRNYTVMSNYHLRDKRISLKAKGLLSLMLSLPDDWNYSMAGLAQIVKEEETAIRNILNELKKWGYLRVDKLMPKKEGDMVIRSRVEYVYTIFELPQDTEILDTEILDVENLGLENLDVENQGQINTEEPSTEITSIEERNKDNLKEKSIKKEKDSLLVQEFEVIWARYPRHEGKQNALKSYIKARHEGVDMVTIKDAVESYRRMCESERREKRYIKQGSTWFNQRSWEDEYGTTKTLGAGTSCENSEFDNYDETEVPF